MLPSSAENINLQRHDNSTAKVSISNVGRKGWSLSAKGILKYVATDLDSGSVIVGSGKTAATQDVTWDAKPGIIANLNGHDASLKAGKYTGELTWTLTDAP